MGKEHLSANHCHEIDCMESAEFRAPVHKCAGGEIIYGLFCKVHARMRNSRWNYFADMNAEEIEAFRHQSYSWHKSTSSSSSRAALHAALHSTDFLDENILFQASGISNHQRPKLPPEIRDALVQMQLEELPDEAALKACFRRLVKQYHPDVQPEHQRNPERFRRINAAYRTLKAYSQFV